MKKLAIKVPEITLFPHHAHLFAILGGIYPDEKYLLPWLTNNYVQIQKGIDNYDFSSGYDILPITENCPMLIHSLVPFEFIDSNYDNVIDFIVYSIELDNYIYMEVDEFYISEYDNYNKNHYNHTILIYGYDYERKIVFAADFFKRRKYNFCEISFEQINQAYTYRNSTFLDGIKLLKKRKEGYFKYNFDENYFKSCIEAYINSYGIEKYNKTTDYVRVYFERKEMLYGLNTYNGLIDDVKEKFPLNITEFFCLYSHFEAIIKIIILLQNEHRITNCGRILDLALNLKKQSEICLKLVMKYNILRNRTQHVIINKINNIAKGDKQIMTMILKNITQLADFDTLTNDCFVNEITGIYFNCFEKNNDIYMLTKPNKSYAQLSFCGDSITCEIELFSEISKLDILIDGKLYTQLNNNNRIGIHNQVTVHLDDNTVHSLRMVSRGGVVGIKKVLSNGNSSRTIINSNGIFIGYDKITSGNWKSRYGKIGYVLPNEKKLDENININFYDYKLYSDESMADMSYLLECSDCKNKIKSCCYREEEQIIRITVTGKNDVQTSVYLLDWTGTNSLVCEIKLVDPISGKTIDRREVKNFCEGLYVIYRLKGVIDLHLKYNSSFQSNRQYGDFYGCFFDS